MMMIAGVDGKKEIRRNQIVHRLCVRACVRACVRMHVVCVRVNKHDSHFGARLCLFSLFAMTCGNEFGRETAKKSQISRPSYP